MTDPTLPRLRGMPILTVLAAGLALAMPGQAPADQGAGAMPRAIHLIESDGEVVRLPRPVASVLVSDPTRADVQLVSASTIFVFARGQGRTRLILLDAEDGPIAEIPIFVGRSIASLKADRDG